MDIVSAMPSFCFENLGRPAGTCIYFTTKPGIEMPGYCHRVAPRRQTPLGPVAHAIARKVFKP